MFDTGLGLRTDPILPVTKKVAVMRLTSPASGVKIALIIQGGQSELPARLSNLGISRGVLFRFRAVQFLFGFLRTPASGSLCVLGNYSKANPQRRMTPRLGIPINVFLNPSSISFSQTFSAPQI